MSEKPPRFLDRIAGEGDLSSAFVELRRPLYLSDHFRTGLHDMKITYDPTAMSTVKFSIIDGHSLLVAVKILDIPSYFSAVIESLIAAQNPMRDFSQAADNAFTKVRELVPAQYTKFKKQMDEWIIEGDDSEAVIKTLYVTLNQNLAFIRLQSLPDVQPPFR